MAAFDRVTERLGIAQICASTLQAKGRVEPGEPDAAGPPDQGDASRRHPRDGRSTSFSAGFHGAPQRAIRGRPRLAKDAHKPWAYAIDALDAALAEHEPRTLSKALTFSAGGGLHCIYRPTKNDTTLDSPRGHLYLWREGDISIWAEHAEAPLPM